jgi:hypothetical protein
MSQPASKGAFTMRIRGFNRISKGLTAAVATLALALSVGGPARAQDHLIGYWPFDEGGADASGGGRDLTLVGGAGLAAGLFGQGLDLRNDDSQYAVRPGDDQIFDFGEGDFTVQIWANFNDTLREQTLIEKFEGQGGPAWTLTKLESNGLQFFASSTLSFTSATLAIPSGQWHHFAVRRAGSVYALFYDGELVAEGSSPETVSDTAMPLLVGKRNAADGRNFAVNGRLDEAAIWSRGLSEEELAFLYNEGRGNPVSRLGIVEVGIDVRPGSSVNPINPGSRGLTPVAILASTSFDPATVAWISVRFGKLGTEAAPVRAVLDDVNGDGLADLVLHFPTWATRIDCGTTRANLTGHTQGGAGIEGSDAVMVVPCVE